jgi:hypothetical protein
MMRLSANLNNMNWESFYSGPGLPGLPAFAGIAGILFVLLILWSVIWKGIALWKAARNGSKVWFIVLLVVNTVGILDILYIFVFGKPKATPIERPRV